ncbi:hypothetical protein EES41_39605 (plasmid) [Streptomyces sp. ADI95-16]|nr:hypothetical protein EES41_39605 [Streptomyces sp. ADI95-16]
MRRCKKKTAGSGCTGAAPQGLGELALSTIVQTFISVSVNTLVIYSLSWLQ